MRMGNVEKIRMEWGWELGTREDERKNYEFVGGEKLIFGSFSPKCTFLFLFLSFATRPFFQVLSISIHWTMGSPSPSQKIPLKDLHSQIVKTTEIFKIVGQFLSYLISKCFKNQNNSTFF
jgi:hypothetical protein